MAKTQRIGIVGGTGYAGAELLRLLSHHPNADIHVVTSRGEAGTPLASAYPQLDGLTDLIFQAPDIDSLAACDVVFFATPHAAAMHDVPRTRLGPWRADTSSRILYMYSYTGTSLFIAAIRTGIGIPIDIPAPEETREPQRDAWSSSP